MNNLASFTDILDDEIENSQPISLPSSISSTEPSLSSVKLLENTSSLSRPAKGTGQYGQFRSVEEIDSKYRSVFSHSFFNVVQSRVIDDALYSDKSMVICAPTGSGKTVIFEMAIVQLLMSLDDKKYTGDFKIIYMAPVKALCSERLSEWYSKFTKLGLLCIEVTGDTDVDFSQLKPYRIIITTPEKWDMLTRRWRDHKALVEVIKLFLIDEVHILNDEMRGPVLEAVVSRMKTIESSVQSNHRIEQLQKQCQGSVEIVEDPPRIRFVAVSATVSNPEDVASWLGTTDRPAAFYKFGDECRPVKLKRVVEGYPCAEGTSIFKFDIILNYKLWPIIQKYHDGKPTLIFCNTRKGVVLTAETLSKELTINFNPEQKARLVALASTTKNKKLQALILSGVGCHHAGMLLEERMNIEQAFRNRDLPILITTTTLAMGVNLPAHLVIIKNTQQYVNGAYQEYSISTVLQMVGRAGRPQFDTEATAVIMTRLADKHRYEALVGGNEPLQSFLHKRLAENLNSEAALATVSDVAECVQWLRSTFLFVRSTRDPKRYLGLPPSAPQSLISKKIEELCVKAMNSLATAGLITMDEASCIESTDAGRLMSIYYLDVETMKNIMKIDGSETLEQLLTIICESHEMSDMHLRVDERRCLNALNRNNTAATIRFPMKGKISTRQMKLNCIIQAVLGCLPITDPSLNQEAMKIMRVADRICKCLVAYVTRPDLIDQKSQHFSAVKNSIILAKCVSAHLWENSPFVSKQLKGIGPTFSALLATAGKVNFMLLEESHPRDLERIMNKGPPTGNTVRKQISLLPKYYLFFTPLNERTIILQLVLQNVSYLSENLEHLTAGEAHKSYIIVGDSDNYLLLLTSIKDKDLISFYDGSITYEITRKRNCEHKIFAHCISSNFVGIDAQCEFLFKNLETPPYFTNTETPAKKVYQKQTCITDVFKQCKRKNQNNDNTLQHTKRKCYNTVLKKFAELREPFNETFEMINKNIYSGKNTSNSSFHEFSCDSINKLTDGDINDNCKNQLKGNDLIGESTADINIENNEEYIDDEQINNILNNIENEICKDHKIRSIQGLPTNKTASTINLAISNSIKEPSNHSSTFQTNVDKLDIDNNVISRILSDLELHTDIMTKPRKAKIKSNFKFIDSLEKSNELNDDERSYDITNRTTGFSSAIKSNIDKYLKAIQNGSDNSNNDINQLLPYMEEINELPSTKLAHECISPAPLPVNSITTNEIVSYKNEENSQPKIVAKITNKDHLLNQESICCLENNLTIASPDITEMKIDQNVLKSNDLSTSENITEFTQNLSTEIVKNDDCEKDSQPKEVITNTETFSTLEKVYGCKNNYNNLDLIERKVIDTSILNTNKNDENNKIITIHDSIALNGPDFSDIIRGQKDAFGLDNSICVTDVISKYLFTATSYTTVNIKGISDNSVQVIRKLNVNVDITKTIATNKLINLYTVTEETENSKEKININESNLKPRSVTCKTINRVTSMDNTNCKDGDCGIIQNINHKMDQVKTISNEELKKKSGNQLSIGQNRVTYEEEKHQDNNICNLSVLTEANTSSSNGYHCTKISGILQKYSTILREKHRTPDLSKSINTAYIDTKKLKIKTPKKPFKIRDIQNCEIPLPETFSCKASSNCINVPIDSNITIMDSNQDPKNTICADSWSSNQWEIDKEIDGMDVDIQDGIHSSNLLPSADDPQEFDFNINESLFDPKALLLCLENDNSDDIIAPPPQFCDNYDIYSPDQTVVNDEHIYDTSSCVYHNYGDSEQLSYKDPKTKNSQLSSDDYAYMHTFTTVNEHTPTRTIALHSIVHSRRKKLNHFKFPQKRKMKM